MSDVMGDHLTAASLALASEKASQAATFPGAAGHPALSRGQIPSMAGKSVGQN